MPGWPGAHQPEDCDNHCSFLDAKLTSNRSASRTMKHLYWLAARRHRWLRGWSMPATTLIIEDDPLLREVCAELMRSLGFDPEVVGSLGEARTRLACAPPSVVILDVTLPDGDGSGLLAEMQEIGSWCATPVIVCTGHPQAVGRTGGVLERPNTVLLGKPFTVRDLQSALERCLGAEQG